MPLVYMQIKLCVITPKRKYDQEYHNHKLQTNQRHPEEELDIYSNKTSLDNKRKAASSLLPTKIT